VHHGGARMTATCLKAAVRALSMSLCQGKIVIMSCMMVLKLGEAPLYIKAVPMLLPYPMPPMQPKN
jgi:UDP:flavonoid glycosyltransferase YjiC (YdhE family)